MLIDESDIRDIRQPYDSTAESPILKGDRLPFPIRYIEEDQIKAILSDGTKLIFNEDYTVEVVDDNSEIPEEEKMNLKNFANVVLTFDLPIGETITLYRETALDQTSEFPQEGRFNSRKIEDALDKLTMQNQEQREALSRTLKLPLTASKDIPELSLPNPEPLKSVKWNEDGSALVNTKYDPDKAFGELEDLVAQVKTYKEDAKNHAKDAEDYADAAEDYADAAEKSNGEVQTKVEKFDTDSEEVFLQLQQEKEEADKAADELRKVIAQGVGQPIGYQYSLNCSENYVPEGSLLRDGAEYSSKQFQGLWDNYLTSDEIEIVPTDVKEIETEKGVDAITYGNGKYVGVGNTGYGIYSENLIDWTSIDITATSGSSMHAIAYGNGKFVAGVAREGLIYSTDGLTWYVGKEKSTDTLIKDARMRKILYLDNYFIAFSSIGGIFYSQDGITWSERIDANSHISDAIYVNNKLIVVGDKIQISTDGVYFEEIPESNNWSTNSITYGNGYFVMVGTIKETGNYFIKTSTDGINWETFSNEKQISEIVYGADRFIATAMYRFSGGYSFSIFESIDGVNWKELHSTGLNESIRFIEFLNDTLIYTTTPKIVYQSFLKKEKTRLNTCTYSEYQQALNAYGFCDKFGVDRNRITPVSSNSSLTFSGKYEGSSNDTLTYVPSLFGIEIGANCLDNNGVVSNFGTYKRSAISFTDTNSFKEFVIKINTGSDIDAVQGIYGSDVSVCISGGYLGCNAQSGNGIFIPIVQISQNQDIWIKVVKEGNYEGRFYYSFTGDEGSYIQINNDAFSTGGTFLMFSSSYIGYGYVGVGTSVDDSKGANYPFLGSIDLNSSYYTDTQGETHYLYSAGWSGDLKGLTVIGTPNNGDTISFIAKSYFKVPTAKQIDRYLIAKKAATDTDPYWYNLYSDGYLEQGSTTVPSSSTANRTVSFLIPYRDIAYSIQFGNKYTAAATAVACAITSSITTTGFTMADAKNANFYTMWETKGYADIAAYEIPRQFVVVANGSINQEQMDWSEWASALQGKANKDGSNWQESIKQIDGQWNVDIAQILSSSGTLSNVTYDLSDYLPKDNYDYTVRFKLAGYDNDSTYGYYLDTDLWQTSSTSITSDDGISSLAYHIYGGTYARQSISIIDLPVGRARYVSVTGMGGDNVYLTVLGYKRIGTNR